MPKNQEDKRYDTAKYGNMTNEELEEILRLDTEVGECEELDADEILCILDVLAEKDEACDDKTVQQAWGSFQQNYMPESKRKDVFLKGAHRSSRRWIALAVSIAIVICIPVVGGAVGWEPISRTIANWTKDFFSFSKIEEEDPVTAYKFETDNPGLQQLYDTVVAGGVTDPVVPMWLPEGYELTRISRQNIKDTIRIAAAFEKENEKIVISYRISAEMMSGRYEKSDVPVEEFEVNGVSYYIFKNKEKTVAAWAAGKVECSMSGELAAETMHQIVESIYRSE